MTRRFKYVQLDVFASRLFDGNPLAVVIDADGLDTDAMQRIARWTNLSETAFLLRPTQPQADYRVRIFTTRQELPFAGHPSVGSAYVAIEAGKVTAGKRSLVQECAAGLLPVQVDGEGDSRVIHVQAPPATIERCDDAFAGEIAGALHTPLNTARMRKVDNGPVWFVCDLDEASVVRALHPDFLAIASICEAASAIGVCVFGRERDGTASIAVRAFCPADGMPEDPVTGSANAAIAAYLRETDELKTYGPRYLASQGREVGRNGIVEVSVDAATSAITIGGACAIGVRGELRLH
ncbi:PhzF family phenazine biosynthesis protein [Rhodanobacter sp. ANJX3]|uniref:PhzF family phenazine biosynthesis protein n=1 Tax=Rhodanobacter sp. ANJX3 TaxID=2723083 RepID=UPI001608DECD|nr:PhzF family phenazine biosynthesis protein [Rhodanobacter sp. ANJX3]MBB5358976.1 PhzF family phenazine biosynthesis protein [Rhodanobacter sp. ANJX3]